MTEAERAGFIETVWDYYAKHGRHDLPWRIPEADGSFNPYKIVVSELMLQQTQVARVIPKYAAFLARFPSARALAEAELGDVLRAWQGLGYNRRAKFLWQAAQRVVEWGAFPHTVADLMRLPGVGANTAGAIAAYVFNQPAVFVETNIRSVYMYHFTRDDHIVSDDFIRDAVARTLDSEHPREFYWALMDYGTYLKTKVRNNQQSKHYVKQSAFHGSKRQVRGQVLRLLSAQAYTSKQLAAAIPDERLPVVLTDLKHEGLIMQKKGTYHLADGTI